MNEKTIVVIRAHARKGAATLWPGAKIVTPGEALTGFRADRIIIALSDDGPFGHIARRAENRWLREDLRMRLMPGGQIISLTGDFVNGLDVTL